MEGMEEITRPHLFISDDWQEMKYKRLIKLYCRSILELYGNDYEANFTIVFESIQKAFQDMGFEIRTLAGRHTISISDSNTGQIVAKIEPITFYK